MVPILVLGTTGSLGHKAALSFAKKANKLGLKLFTIVQKKERCLASDQKIQRLRSLQFQVTVGEITNTQFLKDYLKENQIEIVVSFIRNSSSFVEIETSLVKASEESQTVKKYISAAYGGDWAIKKAVYDIVKNAKIDYSIIDWALTEDFGGDSKKKLISIPGDGSSSITFTHTNDIAKLFPEIVLNDNNKNKIVHVSGDETNYNTIVQHLQQTGGTWEIIHKGDAEQNGYHLAAENRYPIPNPIKVADHIQYTYGKDIDPQNKIWGCHFHFDYKVNDTNRDSKNELHIGQQNEFVEYLKSQGVDITRADCFNSGYGPHIDNNLEIRLETYIREIKKKPNDITPRDQFSHMLLGILWVQLNHFGNSITVHPNTHDDYNEDLESEGNDHNYGPFFIHGYPNWGVDFFYNPRMKVIDPNDEEAMRYLKQGLPTRDGKVLIDTRFTTVMKDEYVAVCRQNFLKNHKEDILDKIRIPSALKHLSIYNTNIATSRRLFQYISTLDSSTRSSFDDVHSTINIQGDSILNQTFLEDVGLIISWLMVNRKGSDAYFCCDIEDKDENLTVARSRMWTFVENFYSDLIA